MGPFLDYFGHVHKIKYLAEINIIRYIKRVYTEIFSSKLVRFSIQISNISVQVSENSSTYSLRGRPESQHENISPPDAHEMLSRMCTRCVGGGRELWVRNWISIWGKVAI